MMNVKKLRSVVLLGLGMSIALGSSAWDDVSPYEACILDCHVSYNTCINAGAPQSDCDRFHRQCRWGCGTPQ